MADYDPLVLSIYDGEFAPMDWVTAPRRVDVTVADTGGGWATIEVDGDDECVEAMTAPGARMVIDYRHDPLDPLHPMRLLSGALTEHSGEAAGQQTRTFDIVGDWVVPLEQVQGWPNPTGSIDHQGDVDAYYTVTGPAETVVKTLVQVNAVDRLRLPLTVAPDLGRGATISVSIRMHPIADRAWPAVDHAGVIVTVDQSGAGLVLDCHVPAVIPDALTEASGVVLAGSYSLTGPTATRAVVMGQGVGTARTMRLIVDAARETQWSTVIEVAVDARDTNDTAVLDLRGAQALAEGAPRTGLRAQLAETDDFRFGVAYQLGDVVTVVLNGSSPLTERVRQVRLVWTADDGLVVTPMVGEVTDDPDDVLFKAVANLARAQRDQGVGT